ncbi:hypothetical protein V491_01459 [Pseudogymnoascus sp. VKM F-3775]|nr:hypothetical protein V491_01459 [Pseudogymnoascus sp. VKM F-3775]
MAAVDFSRYKRIVQYLWDPEPTNLDSSDLPLWCLGDQYMTSPMSKHTSVPSGTDLTSHDSFHETPQKRTDVEKSIQAVTSPESVVGGRNSGFSQEGTTSDVEDGGWPVAFLDDFESKLRFSYRTGFPVIPRSEDPKATSSMSFSVRLRSQLSDQGGFSSDTGWGCMIRSGQSLLANSMVILRLSRGWRRGVGKDEEREIISLFADDPKAPYSIHKFVEHGAEACGKYPGQWFGPSATARCIQELAKRHESADVGVYITGDGSDVYKDGFLSVAKPDGVNFKPTLILVGTRLGIDKVTPVYWEALKASLQMPQSVGIAGGRPSSSHYFVGVQGSHFFYLDPHQTMAALPFHTDVGEYTTTEIDSCHTRRLRRLHIKEMDPSMLIGFLIRDEKDWESWSDEIVRFPGKGIVHIAENDPAQQSLGHERDGAIDDVESFDEEDSEDYGEEPPHS